MNCQMCGDERGKLRTLYTWHNMDSELCINCFSVAMFRFRTTVRKQASFGKLRDGDAYLCIDDVYIDELAKGEE